MIDIATIAICLLAPALISAARVIPLPISAFDFDSTTSDMAIVPGEGLPKRGGLPRQTAANARMIDGMSLAF